MPIILKVCPSTGSKQASNTEHLPAELQGFSHTTTSSVFMVPHHIQRAISGLQGQSYPTFNVTQHGHNCQVLRQPPTAAC
jgi:hypothetical protein